MDIPESEADWRYALVGRTKGDQTVFGSSVKDRSLLWLTTVTTATDWGRISFPTPSPAALAISVAIDAARAADELKSQIRWTSGRDARHVDKTSIEALYAYFEKAMTAAVFSFQTVEAFANLTIARVVKEPMEIKRRQGLGRFTPDELERLLSTEEKLKLVLPVALSMQAPTRTKVWPDFLDLKKIRDSSVHLKSVDHYVRSRPDKESVYYRLLDRSTSAFPKIAVRIVRHFSRPPERWLEAAEVRLERVSPR